MAARKGPNLDTRDGANKRAGGAATRHPPRTPLVTGGPTPGVAS
jgi:hypothetical protein